MEKQHLQMLIVDAARAVLIVRSNEPDVRRQIAALLSSLDGTLSNEQVLEELRALRAGRSTITIVDGPTARVRRPHHSAVASRLWRQLLVGIVGGILLAMALMWFFAQ